MSIKFPENVSGKHWFGPTLQRIKALPFDKDDWSEGGKRTDRGAVDQLIEALSHILPDNAPPPSVVPTWLGGVQAEWHLNGVDLEISANPGEVVEYYFSDGNSESEGSAHDDVAKLKEYGKLIM